MILHYNIQIKQKNAFDIKIACTVDYRAEQVTSRAVLLLKEFQLSDPLMLPANMAQSALFTNLYVEIDLPNDSWGAEVGLKHYFLTEYTLADFTVKITPANALSKIDANEMLGMDMAELKTRADLKMVEHFDAMLPPPEYRTYDVFFGTNRKGSRSGEDTSYGTTRDHALHVGKAEISIPFKHKKGELNRPNWFENLILGESPKKHFTILSSREKTIEAFENDLKQKLADSEASDVLLFIHGYNNTSKQALMRAAQLGYDLNFKGATTAFTWPSLGTVGGYVADMDTAKLSAEYLRQFIKLILQTQPKNLFIIAHSMGNVVLTDALLKMKQRNEFPENVIREIILAAPDIDKDVFEREIIPEIGGAARITLYASENDKALLASERFRSGYDRVGQGGMRISIFDGVESVDATYVDTDLLGHGYYAETKELLLDIHDVLLGRLPAVRALDALLKPVGSLNKTYWRFRL